MSADWYQADRFYGHLLPENRTLQDWVQAPPLHARPGPLRPLNGPPETDNIHDLARVDHDLFVRYRTLFNVIHAAHPPFHPWSSRGAGRALSVRLGP